MKIKHEWIIWNYTISLNHDISNGGPDCFFLLQLHWMPLFPNGTHWSLAKLVASHQFKPVLNPWWYPPGKTTTNSPAFCWIIWYSMSFWFRNSLVKIKSLWQNTLSQGSLRKLTLSKVSRTFFSIFLASLDIIIQTLGFPQWRKLIAPKSRSSQWRGKYVAWEPT